MREAHYRKALALYTFMEHYDSDGLYASLSMEPGKGNRFSLPEEKATALGSNAMNELRAACGRDGADIALADTPADDLQPLGDCLKAIFTELSDYKDSAERLEGLKELTNYPSIFFSLCEDGDLDAAGQWLEDYQGDLPDKERWLRLLDLYRPFCDSWGLYSGDPTVLPLTAGYNASCLSFMTRVSLKGDIAVLVITFRDDSGEHTVELRTDAGESSFYLQKDAFLYMAAISNTGRFAYMKYDGQGTLRSSCEYSRMS